MGPADVMWAVAGGVIIGGFVLGVAKFGMSLLFRPGEPPSFGISLIIVAAIVAAWIIAVKVYGITLPR